MDIKMCQQLVNNLFALETGSLWYWDGYDIVVSQLCQEGEWATWSAIRQHEGMGGNWLYGSKKEQSYVPYPDSQVSRQRALGPLAWAPRVIHFTVAAHPAPQRSASAVASQTHTTCLTVM